MKAYAIRNLAPILWEAAFCVSVVMVPDKILWTTLAFYLGLIIYFDVRGDISFGGFWHHLISGRRFWIGVVCTVAALGLAFAVMLGLEIAFPGLDDGMKVQYPTSEMELVFFAIETIVLAPVAEEAFFRQSLIDFEACGGDAAGGGNRRMLAVMSLAGIVLFALSRTLTPFGIAMVALWGLALTLVYLRFCDVYALITGHFLCCLFADGITVMYCFTLLSA